MPDVWSTYDRAREGKPIRLVGGRDVPPGTPPGDGPQTPEQDCPIVALGRRDGVFWFLDVAGELRKLTARQLGSRPDLAALFLGDTAWLWRHFPKMVTRRSKEGESVTEEESVVGFQVAVAGEFLMALSHKAGIYGDHVVTRQSGVWAASDGRPAVHCGDVVMIGGAWERAGQRLDDVVFALGAATARPARMTGQDWRAPSPAAAETAAIGTEVATELQATLRELWDFRQAAGEIVVLGVLGTAYFGAAAQWRPNLFLTGGAGSGKSKLLSLLRALAPLHHYSSDTSRSGIEQSVTGRAMPILIDESSDRGDQRGAQALMDLVLAATGGEGTKGHRGSPQGEVRHVDVIGTVVFVGVSPPDLQPQHLSRISLVELVRPQAGDDHTREMDAAIAQAAVYAPRLWARALAGWPRWKLALASFRAALGRAGCAAREMDQIGAILAGWWVLTHDGVPDDRGALEGVAALAEFVRRADEVAEDDAPQRMLQHLTSSLVQYDGTTRQEQVGTLIARAWSDDTREFTEAESSMRVLERHGIRVVRGTAPLDRAGRPVPRGGEGDGVWLGNNVEPLRALFRGTAWEGDRWRFQLRRLESARASAATVRIGGYVGRAVWISRCEIDPGG